VHEERASPVKVDAAANRVEITTSKCINDQADFTTPQPGCKPTRQLVMRKGAFTEDAVGREVLEAQTIGCSGVLKHFPDVFDVGASVVTISVVRSRKTGVMFNRYSVVPIELVEVEPEGVPSHSGGGVETGGSDDKGHCEVEVVAILNALGSCPESDVPARSVDVAMVGQSIQERARRSCSTRGRGLILMAIGNVGRDAEVESRERH